MEEGEESEQDNEIQHKREVGINPCSAIIDQHEDQHRGHTNNRRRNTLSDRIGPQRWANRLLLKIMNTRRQRAGPQHHRQVLHLLFSERAGDLDVVANLIVNLRRLTHTVVQDYCQPLMQVIPRELLEAAAAIIAEMEVHIRTAVFIAAGLRITDVVPRNRRRARYHVVLSLLGATSVARQQDVISGNNSVVLSYCRLFVRIRTTHDQPNVEHGGGLNDVPDARRIIDTGKLHEDLIITQPMLLDGRFRNAKLVHAIANSFDRLLNRSLFKGGQLRGFHYHLIRPARRRLHVILREVIADRAAQRADFVRRHSLDLNDLRMILRIRLSDIGKRDDCFAEILAQRLHYAVGFRIHRFIHGYLQDQMGAAFEIKAEVNVLLDRAQRPMLLPGCNGCFGIGAEKDAVHKDQQHSDDEYCFS